MFTIFTQNVCEALRQGIIILNHVGVAEESRAGPVVVLPAPLTTTTLQPCERVLFSAVRDANPFFHLFEALWMLDGRDDARELDHFVSDFSRRFAEPGGTQHGAYGRRWRSALGFDQLDHVVRVLTNDPTSRQCVLQMWDARGHSIAMDDYIGETDLTGQWRDRPCNTHAYLRIRRGEVEGNHGMESPSTRAVLDLTVCCRSNDAIWGAHGANAVHFSVLLEYLAARIGVGVGRLVQMSNNYHAYLAVLRGMAERAAPGTLDEALMCDPYLSGSVRPQRLVDQPATFDEELGQMLRCWSDMVRVDSAPPSCLHVAGDRWRNKFLSLTAWPALVAHRCWELHEQGLAYTWAERIEASDWHLACVEWLGRHERRRAAP